MSILARTAVFRAMLFALLWWVLADGSASSWYVGVPSIAVATLASVALLPPCAWSLTGICRFLPFFVWHSLRGGVDVAWRALHPGLPIASELFEYRLRILPGRPRVFLVKVINLLPGTLSVAVNADVLEVHALNMGSQVKADLIAVEQSVARIFGISLPTAINGNCDEKV